MSNNKLTHDLVRRKGVWVCVNCNTSDLTINAINSTTCPNQSINNVIDAINGTGKFKK